MIRNAAFIAILSASMVYAGLSDNRESKLSITKCGFDRKNLTVDLSWVADSIVLSDEVYAGITATVISGAISTPRTMFRCTALSGDTTFAITDATFDTAYTVSLWTKRQGVWIKPDSLSTAKVTVSSPYKQPISFFLPTKNDTVKALEGRLALWKGSDYPLGLFPHNDTVVSYMPAEKSHNGFISRGAGVRFLLPEPSPAIFMALRCNDSIPAGSLNKIRLYKDSLGALIVQRNAALDSAHKRIVCKTSDFVFPYVVLEDTVAPTVRVVSDTSTCIDSVPIGDTIDVSDNGVNLTYAYFCAQGGKSISSPAASGTIDGKSGRITGTIAAWGAQAAGMRAFCIVSDGTTTDTINLSRRATRTHSDAMMTPENSIVPVGSTIVPENYAMSSCLQPVFNTSSSYDQSKFRIFKWLPENSGNVNGWVEYSKSRDSVFQCRPGALFWMITEKPTNIDFGKGTTVSLKAPFTISLSPKNWTDISIPFGFDMPRASVINASGPAAENLIMYRWVADPFHRTYYPSLVYGSKNIENDSLTDTLYSGNGNGYTVYNPFDTAVSLRFPPIPLSMQNQSATNGLVKTKASDGYCIKITATSGKKELGTAYCGTNSSIKNPVLYPAPPSFSSATVLIKNPDLGKKGSISIYPAYGQQPALFPLEIDNQSSGPLSVTVRAALLYGNKNIECRLMQKQGEGYVVINDNFPVEAGNAGILLAAGTSDQLDSYFRKALVKTEIVQPKLTYTVKNRMLCVSLRNISDMVNYRMSVFDVQGKCVVSSFVKKRTNGDMLAQQFSCFVPSGVYILKWAGVSKSSSVFVTQRVVMPK